MYLLDKNDLAIVAVVLLRLLASGRTLTPAMLTAIRRRDEYLV